MKIEYSDVDKMTFEERAFQSMTANCPIIISIKRDGSFKYFYVVNFILPIKMENIMLVVFKADNDIDCIKQVENWKKIEPDNVDKHKRMSGEDTYNMIQELISSAPWRLIKRFDTPVPDTMEGQGELIKTLFGGKK